MSSNWTADRILETTRGFQAACVIVAAAELDLITILANETMDAAGLAQQIRGDPRATTLLADALTALGLLEKHDAKYSPAPGVTELFDESDPQNVVALLRHQANCLRSWAQLADVVKRGEPFHRTPSVRGTDEDRRSFIEAMEVVSRDAAPRVVASLGEFSHRRLLDIGGGPGTWTRAFLEAHPQMRAVLYDLPEVIPIARRHFEAHGLMDRIELVAGDFYEDESFPGGIELAWVSAIAHQNSREQNRNLYTKAYAALDSGGEIFIRDIVMSEDHVSPTVGAMFAINMLVNTESGGTYSINQQFEDLASVGFVDTQVCEGAREMDWIIRARKS